MYSNFREVIKDFEDPDFFILQVGANDGVTDDDVRKYILDEGWSGLLVEPLPDIFEKLKFGYSKNTKLKFAKVAITPTSGVVKFLRHPTLSQCSGLGVRTRIQSRAEMQEVEVRGLTFDDLLTQFEVKRVDLLQIDVEGYDAELLRMFPFERLKPRLIRYEHRHLKMDDRHGLESMLREKQYQMFWEKNDTVAYLLT